jgi:NADH-quinone oxidoreductase subunit E
MNHYILELALWMLAIFLLGCVIGALARKLFGSEARPVPETVPEEPVKAADVPLAAAAIVAAPVEAAIEPQLRMERPRGVAEARGGKPDDLQRISGIGPKNEKILHTLGFFHFEQIASWSGEHIAWVDDHLKFNGRVVREDWVEQARLLAAGAEDEFEQRFGAGKKS